MIEVKCGKCGWVHMGLAPDDEDYGHCTRAHCYSCGAPATGFVLAGDDDAPAGSTIQGIALPADLAERLKVAAA